MTKSIPFHQTIALSLNSALAHKRLATLAAGVLCAVVPAWADPIFSDNFDGYVDGNQNTVQVDTGYLVSYGGNLPGWDKGGAGAIHAVDLTAAGSYAVMIFQDNTITLTAGIDANDSAFAYQVDFSGGGAVYADRGQATTAADGLIFDILREDGSVLFSYNYLPGAWPGDEILTPASFQYVGDGSGPVRLRIHAINVVGRFNGAVDDLSVSKVGAATAPVITTQPAGATVEAGSDIRFSVAATSATTYQWRKDGVAIAGATSNTYEIADVKTGQAGAYSVVVSNSAGSSTSADAVLQVTAAPTYANYRAAVKADQPIHYYTFDEMSGATAVDSGSLAGLDGSYAEALYTGGLTLGAPSVSPDFGSSVHFDGQPGTFVDLGLFHPGASVTVEVWARLDTDAQHEPAYHDIAGRMDGSYILDFAPGDAVNFIANSDTGTQARTTTAPAVPRAVWHHLVGVFDGTTGTARLYVDGVKGSEQTVGGGLQDVGPDPDRVLIGASRNGSVNSFNFKGFIDEVAFYDKPLSAAQIRAHYHSAVTAAPELSIVPAVIVSWPGFPAGYVLQSATSVEGPYEVYHGGIYSDNGTFIVPVPDGSGSRYFRLVLP
jgi:hypothetical protein